MFISKLKLLKMDDVCTCSYGLSTLIVDVLRSPSTYLLSCYSMKMAKFQDTIAEGNMLERTIDTLIKNYI
jgi:hypothetical protein